MRVDEDGLEAWRVGRGKNRVRGQTQQAVEWESRTVPYSEATTRAYDTDQNGMQYQIGYDDPR